MDTLLQQFESPVTDSDGNSYTVFLYGRNRSGDTWQGWLVFERQSDGRRFATGVETTQPNAQAILYWATGLTAAYFDGALERAKKTPRERHESTAIGERNLAEIERDVLTCFRYHRVVRLKTRRLLDELPFAHADTTRALEDLEKQGGLLIRRTENGTDWLYLTEAGVTAANVESAPHTTATVERELPKSAR
ncbi:MAG TPA: hypothetical protein VG323_11995 [Thermoanaerobaculia bacterium]|nr:hypothetical protein [Thermoanaerobaculia bacterium]